MNKNISPSLTILCLLFATMLLPMSVAPAKADSDIIYVPNDYEKIQWAIDNAGIGNTIIVNSGIYYENVIIDKSLTLKGENGNTIIDGDGADHHVVTIRADNISISGFTVQNSGPDSWDCAIYANNAHWCNISHNTLIHSGHGIWLNYSDSNILTGNNVSYNLVGIGLTSSYNNTVTNNYVFSSYQCGIGLSGASSNIIADNLSKDNDYGIWLDYSDNVTITRNTVIDNICSINLAHSNNNTIFHNNNINNTNQPTIIDSINIWERDYEGNYWSSYDNIDADKDSIADTPYVLDANNIDNYPLLGTYSDLTITWDETIHQVTTICNSTISDFQFNGTAISFTANGEKETSGFCRICIPAVLMGDSFTVYVNGVETVYTLLPRSNATHNYLYLTYLNLAIEEAPDFFSGIVLPALVLLVILAIILAVVLSKRKTSKNRDDR